MYYLVGNNTNKAILKKALINLGNEVVESNDSNFVFNNDDNVIKEDQISELLNTILNKYKCVYINVNDDRLDEIVKVFNNFKACAYIKNDDTNLSKSDEYIFTNVKTLKYDYCLFNKFIDNVENILNNIKEAVIINGDLKPEVNLEIPNFTYGLNENNDFYINVVSEDEDETIFDFYFKDNFMFQFNLPFADRELLNDILSLIVLMTLLCFDLRLIENVLRRIYF